MALRPNPRTHPGLSRWLSRESRQTILLNNRLRFGGDCYELELDGNPSMGLCWRILLTGGHLNPELPTRSSAARSAYFGWEGVRVDIRVAQSGTFRR